MSRIGNRKIIIPEGINVELNGDIIKVSSNNDSLEMKLSNLIKMEVNGNEITLVKVNDSKEANMIHGTMNANLTNMIIGLKEGYKKDLEIIGVGYRFNVKGDTLVINAGYSHPVELSIPAGLKVVATSNTEITISGSDKVLLGEFAANVRKVRQPEPYKGKGIKFEGEVIRRKEGKTGKK